jgi:hypothetical protein
MDFIGYVNGSCTLFAQTFEPVGIHDVNYPVQCNFFLMQRG